MKFFPITSLLLIILMVSPGCEKAVVKSVPLTEAHENFLKITNEEYKLPINTVFLKNTVWVYLPLEESFINVKATREGPTKSGDPKETQSINFLEGEFKDSSFHIEYDISSNKSYNVSHGYNSTVSESFQEKQRAILNAITNAYNEADPAPDFFVIVIADIINGLESETLFHFKDLKRATYDMGFSEEFSLRRSISGTPQGNRNIIGDHEGKHVNYRDISWGEFLSRQMVHRIQNKYTRSAHRPSNDTIAEIKKIVATTLQAYKFDGYDVLKLKDLNLKSEVSIQKPQIEALFEEELKESKGRLINIKFDL